MKKILFITFFIASFIMLNKFNTYKSIIHYKAQVLLSEKIKTTSHSQIKEWSNLFEKYALKNNITIDLSDYNLVIINKDDWIKKKLFNKPTHHTQASCQRDFKLIVLWEVNKFNFFHELGHCILNLDHTDDSASIMFKYNQNKALLEIYENEMLNDMFQDTQKDKSKDMNHIANLVILSLFCWILLLLRVIQITILFLRQKLN